MYRKIYMCIYKQENIHKIRAMAKQELVPIQYTYVQEQVYIFMGQVFIYHMCMNMNISPGQDPGRICKNLFPIDFAPNGISFGAKSIGKG